MQHEVIIKCKSVTPYAEANVAFLLAGKKKKEKAATRAVRSPAELLIIDASAFARFCSHLSYRKSVRPRREERPRAP